MKTAIEWYTSKLEELDIEVPYMVYAEAKEIEKEQRKMDFRAGWHGKHKDLNCEFYLTKHITNDFKTK